MGCEDVRDLLAIYVGGECRDEDAETVEAHVALCGPCARELDLYREARAALATLADAPAPPGLGKAIWAGVKAEISPRAARPRPPWFDEALRYAALLMLGIGGGVLAYQLRGPAPEPAVAVDRPLLTNFRTVAPEIRPMPLPRGSAVGDFYLPRVEAVPADGAKDF
jgi:anti-sigma factor (TIGR02949 family)